MLNQSTTSPHNSFALPDGVETSLFAYLKEISKIPSLSPEEEKELAKACKNGNENARQKLIQSNLRLVVQIAKRAIHKSNVPMIDLIQEGNLGLMIAVDKFNWEYGYKFSTYATWWIRQTMFKAISEQSFCVKIPVYVQETLSRFNKAKRELQAQGKQKLSVEQIAEKIKISAKKIDGYLSAYTQSLSIDAAIELPNGSTINLSETLINDEEPIITLLEKKETKRELQNLLKCLKEKEKNVINWRFGFDDVKKKTLEEIGQFYGVTKECVRQTELKAIKKLKFAIETNCNKSDFLN